MMETTLQSIMIRSKIETSFSKADINKTFVLSVENKMKKEEKLK